MVRIFFYVLLVLSQSAPSGNDLKIGYDPTDAIEIEPDQDQKLEIIQKILDTDALLDGFLQQFLTDEFSFTFPSSLSSSNSGSIMFI